MSLGGESLGARGLRKRDRDKRNRWGSASLNLVSLMDIFTILVFFLLVNSSDVETISSKSSVKLPESISSKRPDETLVLLVNSSDLLVQGRKIASIADVEKLNQSLIVPLQTELQIQYKRLYGALGDKVETGAITIMGDREIPYRLLKKIMMTCADANFGNISLAVQKKAVSES
ncbi:MAG: biopolymer transporter ExbD [Gammaproteobacteria bacterium]|nr:biopolymer transporter ExbD [Gammaproteobacteria bacterium]